MTPPNSPDLPGLLIMLAGTSCVALVTWATWDLRRRFGSGRRFG